MKKSSRLKLAFAFITVVFSASSANIAMAASDSFENDFESYYINTVFKTWENVIPKGKLISNAKPLDDDYSDTEIYPDGKYYEGNAAQNLFVYDYMGNKIYGGLEGYTGYYSLPNSTYVWYNGSNERCTVTKLSTMPEYGNALRLEPSRNDGEAFSQFGKEDIDLSEISIIESDISVSAGTNQKNLFETGIYLTKNPQGNGAYEDKLKLIKFSGEYLMKEEPLKISLLDNEIYTHKVGNFYGDLSFIKVRVMIDNNGVEPKVWAELLLDGSVVAYTEPQIIQTDFFDNQDAVYGLLYRSDANQTSNIQPRFVIDNIKFGKKSNSIKNRAELEQNKLECLNPSVILQLDGDIEQTSLDAITMTDESGNAVSITSELVADGVKITAGVLEPQSVYKININGLIYDNYFEFNDSITVKTAGKILITGGEKILGQTDCVKVMLKNNTTEKMSPIVVVTVNNSKNSILRGVYYKQSVLEPTQEKEILINNLSLPEEDYFINVFTIDEFGSFKAMSDKLIIE